MKYKLTTDKPTFKTKITSSVQTQCYLLLALPIIGFFVFTIYPILWAAAKAWFYYDGIASSTRYVGFENFITLFTKDTKYWGSWLTTLKFTLLKLPVEIMLALFLAVLLNSKVKGSGFFRSAYFLPNIVSVAIIGLIFSNLFDYFGFINAWLIKLGILESEVEWFADTDKAMFILILGSIWSCFGVNVLYFCAALTNVPAELYESAEIDGAGSVTKFFRITIPMIAPVFQIILLMGINGTLKTGDYVIVMTNGAPAGTTYTVGAYMINAFLPGFAGTGVNIGYGCAVSMISSVIFAGVAAVYMTASKNMSKVY